MPPSFAIDEITPVILAVSKFTIPSSFISFAKFLKVTVNSGKFRVAVTIVLLPSLRIAAATVSMEDAAELSTLISDNLPPNSVMLPLAVLIFCDKFDIVVVNDRKLLFALLALATIFPKEMLLNPLNAVFKEVSRLIKLLIAAVAL